MMEIRYQIRGAIEIFINNALIYLIMYFEVFAMDQSKFSHCARESIFEQYLVAEIFYVK